MDRIANATVPEIEITPEMIEAGTLELAGFNQDFESDEDAVCRIYRAMVAVSPSR